MNAVETLRSLLAKNIVRFTYQKVNGEIRHAIGTRSLDLARTMTGADIPAPRFGEQPYSYYDLDKMGWRSYKPELLISIDGIVEKSKRYGTEIPVLGGKPFSKPSENDKGVVADLETEMPSHTENFPMSEILKGLFGGVGFGGGVPKEEIRKTMDKDIVIGAPAHSPKIGTPVTTETGVAVPVEDFAKMIAHYVVVELVEKLTR